ncbi:hypothetical protein MGA3_10825 [Bacillus methanolicus MGA3]|uniref:Secreted protein n=1 Tax=Bacillus methanolicus (strain MGA3 / ATCC 53907) TaxID=796606 RepID=I3E2R9_BACMM|nr:hypothetical protein BMMGA3_03250 [Bacillus methanolicus MGA3]EIJ80790.1 hypothetical protein MGA3_10825 [Bacillus methanolicus MGA3]
MLNLFLKVEITCWEVKFFKKVSCFAQIVGA